MFKSGGSADQVITQAILKGANESIRNVYQNVADKYQVGPPARRQAGRDQWGGTGTADAGSMHS